MVNNAGLGVAMVEDTAEEDYGRVMEVCVRGTFLGMKHAIHDAATNMLFGDGNHQIGISIDCLIDRRTLVRLAHHIRLNSRGTQQASFPRR